MIGLLDLEANQGFDFANGRFVWRIFKEIWQKALVLSTSIVSTLLSLSESNLCLSLGLLREKVFIYLILYIFHKVMFFSFIKYRIDGKNIFLHSFQEVDEIFIFM